MKVVWSQRAEARLECEADYIARDRPLVAIRWLREMRERVRRLETFPFSGRRVLEFPQLPVREVILPPFRVVYFPDRDVITIVNVKHSREKMRRHDVSLRDLR